MCGKDEDGEKQIRPDAPRGSTPAKGGGGSTARFGRVPPGCPFITVLEMVLLDLAQICHNHNLLPFPTSHRSWAPTLEVFRTSTSVSPSPDAKTNTLRHPMPCYDYTREYS